MSNEQNIEAARQAHEQEQQAPKRVATSNVVGGVRRLTIGGAEATDGSYRKFINDAAPVSNGDPLATARTPAGAPVARELRGDDTIEVGAGIRTTVRAAIAAGFISRDVLTSGNAQQQHQQEKPNDWQLDRQVEQTPEPVVEKLADLPAEAHQSVTEFQERVGNMDQQKIARSLIETGTMSDDMARAAATQMGVEPEVVTAKAAQVRDEFERQAHTMLGESASEVFNWAREKNPALLKECVNAHVYNAKPDAYVNLAGC